MERAGAYLLDVLELRRAAKRLVVPVQVAEPSTDMSISTGKGRRRIGDKIDALVQVRIPGPNVADIALEVLHVHDVEAHDRLHHCRVSKIPNDL